MKKVLTTTFFRRSALSVAQDLLGMYLVRTVGTGRTRRTFALQITETEAYHGFNDKASHAFRGKTPRNTVMFGTAGIWYVYFTYGMHYMLNMVTGEKDHPSAVLIRGTETVRGPGRLTKYLEIDKMLNGKPAAKTSGLWIEDRGEKVPSKLIERTARIGIDSAGPVWSQKLHRFVVKEKK